jgi:hypothetical protein
VTSAGPTSTQPSGSGFPWVFGGPPRPRPGAAHHHRPATTSARSSPLRTARCCGHSGAAARRTSRAFRWAAASSWSTPRAHSRSSCRGLTPGSGPWRRRGSTARRSRASCSAAPTRGCPGCQPARTCRSSCCSPTPSAAPRPSSATAPPWRAATTSPAMMPGWRSRTASPPPSPPAATPPHATSATSGTWASGPTATSPIKVPWSPA